MTQDLQQLLDKIQRDGVDKAQAEADKILSDARAQAKTIIESAQADAARVKVDVQQKTEAFEHRAEETMRQAARDTVLNVEKAVTRLLEQMLLKDVNATFDKEGELIAGLAVEAIRAYITDKGGIEVDAAAKLADTLRAKLASEAAQGVTIVTDETAGTGFRVRLAGGRIEHDFTGKAVAEALSKQLRPRLAALLKP